MYPLVGNTMSARLCRTYSVQVGWVDKVISLRERRMDVFDSVEGDY